MTVQEFVGPGVDDDDSGGPRPMPVTDSPLESLLAAMRTPLPNEQFALSPPKRPEVEVRLRSNVDLDELNEWRKDAQDSRFPTGVDMARLACVLIANASIDVLYASRSTGKTLLAPEILALYPDAVDGFDAVKRFFGNEELWLATVALPALTKAWSGGGQDDDVLRPITTDQ